MRDERSIDMATKQARLARDLNELVRSAIVRTGDGKTAISISAIDAKGIMGTDGRRHDVMVGPCCCGATHTREHPAPVLE